MKKFSKPLSEEIQGKRCPKGFSVGWGRNSLNPVQIQMLWEMLTLSFKKFQVPFDVIIACHNGCICYII